MGAFFEHHNVLPQDLFKMTFPQLNALSDYFETMAKARAFEDAKTKR
jgi:hypothetical protein